MAPALVVNNLWQCSKLLFLSLESKEKYFFFFTNIANPDKKCLYLNELFIIKGNLY